MSTLIVLMGGNKRDRERDTRAVRTRRQEKPKSSREVSKGKAVFKQWEKTFTAQ